MTPIEPSIWTIESHENADHFGYPRKLAGVAGRAPRRSEHWGDYFVRQSGRLSPPRRITGCRGVSHVPAGQLIQGNQYRAVAWDRFLALLAALSALARVSQEHACAFLETACAVFSPNCRRNVRLCWVAQPALPAILYRAVPGSISSITGGAKRWNIEVERASHPDFLFVGHTHVAGKL